MFFTLIAPVLTNQLIPYFRHRRTHEARADGEGGNYSDEDLEAEEDEFGVINEESPPPVDRHSHNNYMQTSMSNSPMTHMTAASMRMPATGIGMGATHGMAPPPMMTSQHLLQQQM